MSKYKESQYTRQEKLIESSDLFSGGKGNGYFRGKVLVANELRR